MSDEPGKRTLDDLAVGMLVTWCGDEYRLTEREYDVDSPGWVGVTTGRGESKQGIKGLFRPWLINDKDFAIVKPSDLDRVTAERDTALASLAAARGALELWLAAWERMQQDRPPYGFLESAEATRAALAGPPPLQPGTAPDVEAELIWRHNRIANLVTTLENVKRLASNGSQFSRRDVLELVTDALQQPADPAPTPGVPPTCGTCGGSRLVVFRDGPWTDSKPCPDCAPQKKEPA